MAGRCWIAGFRRPYSQLITVKRGDPEALAGFPLSQSQLKPFFLQVLAQGGRLKIRFLWFQCLKRQRCEWQKGNASLNLQ